MAAALLSLCLLVVHVHGKTILPGATLNHLLRAQVNFTNLLKGRHHFWGLQHLACPLLCYCHVTSTTNTW